MPHLVSTLQPAPPQRSLTVALVCGTEEVLEDLDEPETCVHTGVLRSPLACTAAELESRKAELKVCEFTATEITKGSGCVRAQ